MRTEDIATEVFFFPAAAHTEKDGTFTNTQRMVQWHHKAVEPQDEQRSDLWFIYHLGRRIREKLAGSTDECDRPVLDLTWDYPTEGPHRGAERRRGARRDQRLGCRGRDPLGLHAAAATTARPRAAAGSTAAATPTASTRRRGANPRASRTGPAPSGRGRGPRTAASSTTAPPPTRKGRPWSERKALVWWDAEQGRWTGHDTPDFEADKPPDYRPPEDASGPAAIAGDDPFIMQADGRGWLYAPAGVADGPLPTHYEPQDSPVRNLLLPPAAQPRPPGLRAREQPLPPRPRRARAPTCFPSPSRPTG